jgi:hypothetical protein
VSEGTRNKIRYCELRTPTNPISPDVMTVGRVSTAVVVQFESGGLYCGLFSVLK